MALESVTSPNEPTILDDHALLRKSRQCAALTRVVRAQLGGATISEEEDELFLLTSDLAKLIYEELVHRPADAADNGAFEVAGKLSATVDSLVEVNERISPSIDDEQRLALVTRIVWLQNSVDDLAQELVGVLEDVCAERAGPMPG